MMKPYDMSAILKSVFVKPPSWIVVELYYQQIPLYSLLIELTFRGLRNFAAGYRMKEKSRISGRINDWPEIRQWKEQGHIRLFIMQNVRF